MSEELRKYTDVIRLGHRDSIGVIREGDYVTVYEKLDGANASFKLGFTAEPSRCVAAYSRNTELSAANNLRGFYEWSQRIDALEIEEGYVYYGEWLVKHKVDYGDNAGTFYLYDIYSESDEAYAPTDFVVAEAVRLKLAIAPILYAGPYVSFEHLASFVGRSALAKSADTGEGIVVKNVDYRDKYGRQTFVKMVSDGFREMQPQKAPRDPNAPLSPEATFVQTFMTRARIEKLTHKLVDEGVIPEDFGLSEVGAILRELGNRVIADMLKEEAVNLPHDCDEKALTRAVGKTLPLEVKAIITEREAL